MQSNFKKSGVLIRQMILYDGSTEDYFRSERSAEALPPHWAKFKDSDGITDFGLRLYCIRVSAEILILLNGDRKTTQSPLDCSKCKPHFEFANKIADAFYEAKHVNKEIEIDGQEINFDDGFCLNI